MIALDFAYAHGYLETHAEAARGSYDVPGRADPIVGWTYYGEAKYTLTPRLFVATRLERNDYPFIRAFGSTWASRLTDFVDGELGVRVPAVGGDAAQDVGACRSLVGGAGRERVQGQGGPAFAMQVSQSFDLTGWFERAR